MSTSGDSAPTSRKWVNSPGSNDGPAQLLRDLRLHQAELEEQNRQLVEAQGLLEQSRASYVELFDYAPVGYVTLDRSGLIRQINLTGAGLLEAAREKLIGRSFRFFLARKSRAALDDHLRRRVGDQRKIVTELHKKDDRGVLELTSGPIDDHADSPLLRMIMVDISERKRADEERLALLAREREARELAESANRAREDFLAVISHELRTPLAPMTLWVEILRRHAAAPGIDLMNRAIDALAASVTAQRNLIDDLLDLSRSRAGIQHIAREPVSLTSTVRAAINVLKAAADDKRITIRSVIGARAVHPVWGDAARLQQVVQNLISNAIKFTPEHGQVTVRLHGNDGSLILVVEDNGVGIDPSFLPHVFESFRQQDTTPGRRHGGLGLGLCIARELVALHGGTIVAASAGRGRGAKFTVTVPAARDKQVRAAEPTPPPIAGASPASLAGLRLLVIEDERRTREVLTIALEQFGANILAVDSAPAGRDALKAFCPDVVLCDIAMPGEDGYTFVSRLRRAERRSRTHIPVFALTAHSSSKDRRRVRDSGFDLHLPKPVKTEDLLAAILSLVKQSNEPDRNALVLPAASRKPIVSNSRTGNC